MNLLKMEGVTNDPEKREAALKAINKALKEGKTVTLLSPSEQPERVTKAKIGTTWLSKVKELHVCTADDRKGFRVFDADSIEIK